MKVASKEHPHFTGVVQNVAGPYMRVRWCNGMVQMVHHAFVVFI